MFRVSSHLSRTDGVQKVVDELINIGGGRSVGFGKNRALSLPDAIAKALISHYNLKSETPLQYLNGNNGHANGHANGHTNGVVKTNGIAVDQPTEVQPELAFAEIIKKNHFDICGSCGVAALVYEEGCKKCYNCGYSAC